MLDYDAVGIAEGFIECDDDDDDDDKRLEAWQHLITTGLCWTLQGSFGRKAKQLIDDGLCFLPK